MNARHLVARADEAVFGPPPSWAEAATKYRRWAAVDEEVGAVHTGFGVCELGPDGTVPTHVHSFEESFFVVEGSATLQTPEGAFRVSEGDYGLLPVGVPHRWHHPGDGPARWAELQAPVPRRRYCGDTALVPELVPGVHSEPAALEAAAIDVRDPRTRRFGTITPQHMDAGRQSQEMLAVSASQRTALSLYSGITVKMMVDTDLGAQLSTMFMVQYAPDGVAGPHDHPFEETYYFLEGEAEATFDGERHVLRAGDVAWAGVGCRHSFRNLGRGPLRWLETQAPQPPARHSYRFARDWDYLEEKLR